MTMTNQCWTIAVVALLLGGLFAYTFMPREVTNEIEVEIPGETIYVNQTVVEEVEVEVEVPSEGLWLDRAWDQILDEFDNDDDFYTCNGHEYDDDELEVEFENGSISWDDGGDYTFTGTWEFDFDDDSDEQDCTVDRSYQVDWDDDDVEDADWNEGDVTEL